MLKTKNIRYFIKDGKIDRENNKNILYYKYNQPSKTQLGVINSEFYDS
jgi:hypothetical protein